MSLTTDGAAQDASASALATVDNRGSVSLLTQPMGYRESRQHLFPSEHSLQWYMRVHRKRLVDAGALLMISGRLFIQPGAFDQVLIEEGRANAAACDV